MPACPLRPCLPALCPGVTPSSRARAPSWSLVAQGVKDAKHILHLQEILAVANNKVMHIVRDGRDVAASLAARSNEYTWESSMGSCGGSGLAGRLAGRLAGYVAGWVRGWLTG